MKRNQEEILLIMQLELGNILEGKVTGITKFGAFVALPEGKTGMVHISEVSDSFVREIRDFLTENQQVTVKVINIDENGKIALSIKRAKAELDKLDKNKTPKAADAPYEFRPVSDKKRTLSNGNDSFEEMMQRFKTESDEKMSDLKRSFDSKRGSPGFNRKNSNKY